MTKNTEIQLINKELSSEGKEVCKNCGTRFEGNFCPNCGQSTKDFARPMRFMIMDFMGTLVAFDTRLIKTLGAILFKPGQLATDFLKGKRVAYMPPFRFYVFISFVMFLLISLLTSRSIDEDGKSILGQDSLTHNIIINSDTLSATDLNIENEEISISTTPKDSLKKESNKGAHNYDIEIGDEEDSEWEKKIKDNIQKIVDYPELYLDKVYQFSSWALFFFMPFFAFSLWLLFRKNQALYIGHLIFSINIHSFIFIINVLLLATAYFFPGFSIDWMWHLYWLIPIYQVFGAIKLYKRKWHSAFFRLTLAWILYGIVLIAGITFTAVIALVEL